MQSNLSLKWLRNGFLLAILLHLLLLCSFVIRFSLPIPTNDKVPPQAYVPSYVYTGGVIPSPPVTPHFSSQRSSQTSQSKQTIATQSALSTTDPWGYQKPASSAANTSQDLEDNDTEMEQAMKRAKSQNPMLLIGDESATADPLVKLIGRSLSAHFNYPRMEGSFGIRGKVMIEMLLHPNGVFSNIRIVQSSDNADFDSAALYAVNTAPIVYGADKFITKPKYMIIGFIFD